ncbi:MAG: T9SS type A sorting domain-containing protein [Bacteroidia bacterium]|nr:T9SS type A sorting domain-containing protein [Bacteroidia bacterium]
MLQADSSQLPLAIAASDALENAPELPFLSYLTSAEYYFSFSLDTYKTPTLGLTNPTCLVSPIMLADKWVKFRVPDSVYRLTFTIQFPSDSRFPVPILAFYRKESSGNLREIGCKMAGDNIDSYLLKNLVPGETIWLRLAEANNLEINFILGVSWHRVYSVEGTRQFRIDKKGNVVPLHNNNLTPGNRICLSSMTSFYNNKNTTNCGGNPTVCGWTVSYFEPPCTSGINTGYGSYIGQLENPVFFYFTVSPNTPQPLTITITINSSTCSLPAGALPGAQVGIWSASEANVTDPTKRGGCKSTFHGAAMGVGTVNITPYVNLTNGVLPPGEYILMIDGINQSMCDFTFSGPVVVDPTPVVTNGILQGNSYQLVCGLPLTLDVAGLPSGPPYPNFQVQWQGPNNFTSNQVNPTVTPAVAGTYTMTVTGSGNCPINITKTVNVTLSDLLAPAVSSNSPVCQGATLQLTANTNAAQTPLPGPAVTYSWSGPNGFSSTLQNPSIPNMTSAQAGTYTVTITRQGCNSASSTTQVNIIPLPAAPTVANVVRCGPGSVTITAIMGTPAGNQIRVYDQPTGGNLLATAGPPFHATLNINQTSTFYVEPVTNPGNCAGTRTQVIAEVVTPPSKPNASDAVRCGPGQVTFTASMGSIAGTHFYLYTQATGGTPISTAALPSNALTASPTATTSYYVGVSLQKAAGTTPAIECFSSIRDTVVAVVNPIPAIPSTPSVGRCGGGVITFTVNMGNPAGNLIQLLHNNTLISTDNSPPYEVFTFPITTTTTFCLQSVNTSTNCISPCGQAIAVYDSIPSPPAGSAAPRCSTGAITITATMPGPILGQVMRLYEQPTGGNPIASQSGSGPFNFTVQNVSTNTTYYLEVFRPNTQCASPRVAVPVTINPNPAPPISQDVALCESGVATFTALMGSPAGNLMHLYSVPIGGSPISTSNSPYYLSTPNITTTTNFYFESINTVTGCTSSTRSAYQVIVNKNPAPPSAPVAARCGSGSVTLTVSLGTIAGLPPANAVQLYTQSSGGTPIGIDDSPPYNLTTPAFTKDTTVWIDALNQATGCSSTTRVPVQVKIEPLPGEPSAPPIARCGVGPVTFTAQMGVPPANQIRVYESIIGGNPIAVSNGPIFEISLPSIGTTTTYYLASRFNTSGCETRKPFTVTIYPEPVPPVAQDVSVCSCNNATINMNFINPPFGNVVRIYSVPVGGTPLQTLFTPPYQYAQSICTTTTFYIEAEISQTGCISKSRSTVIATALPRPSEPIAQNQSRCGSGSVIIPVAMGQIPGTSVRLYNTATSTVPIAVDNLSPFALSTPEIQGLPATTVTSTFFIESILDGTGCVSTTRKEVVVSVHPVPGSPSANKIVKCGAGGAATFTAIMGTPAGTELRLYTTVSPIANPIATATNNPYLLTFNLLTTSTYYIENYDGNTGCSSARVPVTAEVGIIPGPPLTFNVKRCGPGPVTLSTAMGNPAASFLQLFDSPVGGNLIETTVGDNLSFYLPQVQTSTTFYVRAVRMVGTDSCFSNRVPVTVDILETPSPPLVENVSRCGGGSVTFTALMGDFPGNEVRMYTTSGATTPIQLDNVPPFFLVTPPISIGSTSFLFSVINTNNGCESPRVLAIATASQTPGIPSVASISRCGSGVGTFTITMGSPPGDVIQMYTQPSGGTPIATAIISPYQITTPILTTNTTYYFEAVSSADCRSNRVSASIIIFPIPEPPSVASIQVCERQPATFTATGVSGAMQVNLYSSASASNELAFSTGPEYLLPLPSDSTKVAKTTTFYVNAEDINTGCRSDRVPVLLVVNPIPTMPPYAIAQRCGAGSVIFTLQMGAISGTEIRLYKQPIGGSPIATDGLAPFLLESEPITSNTTFYASSYNAATGCESDRRLIEGIIKGPKPGSPIAPPKIICGQGKTDIIPQMGTPPGTKIRLWDSPISGTGTIIDEGIPPNFTIETPELNSTTIFYLESINELTGCISDRVPVQIIVAPIPGAPDAISLSRCGEGSVTFTFQMGEPAGIEIRLYTSPSSSTSMPFRNAPYLFSTPPLSTSIEYYISSANPTTGCESSKTKITATINPIPGKAVVSDVARCGAGSVQIISQMTSPQGDLMRLYSTPVGGNPIYTAGPPFIFTTPLVTTTTTYYVESAFQFTGCVGERSPVVVTIHPIPGTPRVRNISICRGQLAIFSVTPTSPAGDIMRLFNSFIGGDPISTDPSYPYELVTPAVITSTFYVENLNTVTQCASDRQPVIVFVNDVPGEPYVQSLSRCGAGELTFTAVMNTPPGNEIRMYDAPNLGTLLQRNTTSPYTFTINQFPGTQTYYFESINTVTGCISKRTAAVAEVFLLPPAPFASSVARCGPGAITFSPAMGAPLIESEIRLFDFDNNLLAVTSELPFTLQVANLTTTTRFFLQTYNTTTGCSSSTYFVDGVIHPIPGVPSANEVKRCGPGTVSISILMGEPAGTVINLYEDPFQQAPLARDFTSPYLISGIHVNITRTFYLESLNEVTGCKSSRREAIVHILPIPAPPISSDVTLCGSGQVTFSFAMNNPPGTEIRFYEANVGGNFIVKDEEIPYEITTPVLQNTTTFFASSYHQNTACESPRVPIVASIAPKPGVPYAPSIKQCAYLPLVISATMGDPPGDVIRLYSTPGANLPLAIRQEPPYLFELTQTESSLTYYLESFNSTDGCRSELVPVEVQLFASPSLPQVLDVIRCGPGTAVLSVKMGTIRGEEIRVYDSPIGGQLIAVDNTPPYEITTPFLQNTVTYYVESYSSLTRCQSPRTPVVVRVVSLPSPPIVTGATPVCTGQWLNLEATASSDITIFWEGPLGFTSIGPTLSRHIQNVQEGGFYKAFAVANGCTSRSTSVLVEVRPTPEKPIGFYYSRLQQARPLCEGEELNLGILNINDYPSSTTFEWIGPNGYTSYPHPFPAIPNTSTIQEGAYYVRAFYNGCASTISDAVDVRIFKRPQTPVATSNIAVCEGGGPIRLFATEVEGSIQYIWIGPNGFSSTLRSPTLPALLANAGNYMVQAINEHGCTSARSTTTVTVQRRLPPPALSYNGPLCQGQTLRLTISYLPGATFHITGPSNFIAQTSEQEVVIPNMTHDKAGTYRVTATQGVCTSQAAALNVIVRSQPAAPILSSNGPVCEGQLLKLTAFSSGGGAILWQGPNGFEAQGEYVIRSGVTLQDAGTYTATVIGQGCTSNLATISVIIARMPRPPSAINNGPVCLGDVITLLAEGSPEAKFFWQGPDAWFAEGATVVRAVSSTAASGHYTVSAILGGCTTQAQTSVVVIPLPTPPTITTDGPKCPGEIVNFIAEGQVGSTYYWYGPAGFSAQGARIQRQINTQGEAGIYSVIAVLNGCSSTITSVGLSLLTVPAVPEVFNNTPQCEGQMISLSATSHDAAQYIWQGPLGFRRVETSGRIYFSEARLEDAGVYSVAAIANGCTSAFATTTVQILPFPTAPQLRSNSARCVGNLLLLTAETAYPARYIWNGPAGFIATGGTVSRQLNSSLEAGVYQVRAIVGACTSEPASLAIRILPPLPEPIIQTNGPQCVPGFLSLTALGIENAQYLWQGPNAFSATGQTVSRVIHSIFDAGVYTVTAVLNGCSSTATTNVIVYDPNALITVSSNSPLCVGSTLQLNATSIPNATYTWRGPGGYHRIQRNPIRSNLRLEDAGTYYLTVVIGACTSRSFSLEVNVYNYPPTPVAGYHGPLCEGQTLSLMAAPIPGARYYWTGPNQFTSTLQNPRIPSVTTLERGTYKVSAFFEGCTSSTSMVEVEVFPTPIKPVVESSSFVCSGQNIRIAARSTPGAQYHWTGPNQFFSSVQNPVLQNVTSRDDGLYQVIAVIRSCTSEPSVVPIRVLPTPSQPIISANTSICEGQTLNLAVDFVPNLQYQWIGPDNLNKAGQLIRIPNATTLQKGEYTVIAIQEGCTSSPASVWVNVEKSPKLTPISANTPLCEGQSLQLWTEPQEEAIYLWSGPAGFTSSTIAPILANATTAHTGNYSLSVVIGNCTSQTQTKEVIVKAKPVAPNISLPNVVCVGQRLQLIASGNPEYNYFWQGPNLFESRLQSSSLTADVSREGEYSVVAIHNGCTSDVVKRVLRVADPFAHLRIEGNSVICEGGRLALNATYLEGFEYRWSGPSDFSATSASIHIENATKRQAGIYSLVVYNSSCTSNLLTIDVRIIDMPVQFGIGSNSPICEGQNLLLTAHSIAGATYLWQAPDGWRSENSSSTRQFVRSRHSGIYTLNFAISGCTTQYTIPVEIRSQLQAPMIYSNAPLCENQALELTTPTIAGASYHWKGPLNWITSEQNPTRPNTTVEMSGEYQLYYVIHGCTSLPAIAEVIIHPLPRVSLQSNSPVCEGAILRVTASSLPGLQYSWQGPANFMSTENSFSFIATTNHSGVYLLRVANANCTTQNAIPIVVNPRPNNLQASNNGPLCAGQTLNLTATTIGGARYLWRGPAGFSSTQQNPSINSVSTLYSGQYSVVAVIGNCSSEIAVTTVTIQPSPIGVQASSNAPVCEGQTLELSATYIPGATYSWRGPQGFVSYQRNPQIFEITTVRAGNYSLQVSLAGCPSVLLQLPVSVLPAPSGVEISSNGPVCAGQPIILRASSIPNAQYRWSGPASFQSTLQNPVISTATTVNSGTYSLLAIIGSCTSRLLQVEVKVIPVPRPFFASSNTPVCTGNTASFTATTFLGANYQWIGPSNFSSNLQNPSITNVDATNSGIYTVVATVEGCTAQATTRLEVRPTPEVVSIGSNSPVCHSRALLLTAMANSSEATSYLWSGPNGFSATGSFVSHSRADWAYQGTYSVVAIANGCTSAAKTTEVILKSTPALPTISVNTPVCWGQTLWLHTEPVLNASYLWAGPNNFSSTLLNPSIISATKQHSGVYSLAVVVDGCTSDIATWPVVVNHPELELLTTSQTICQGDTARLSLFMRGTGPWSVNLVANGETFRVAVPTSSFTLSLNPLRTTTYQFIEVIDANGCKVPISGATATIHVEDIPTVSMGNVSSICYLQRARIPIEVRGTASEWNLTLEENGTTHTISGSGEGRVDYLTQPLRGTTTIRLLAITNKNSRLECSHSLVGNATQLNVTTSLPPSFRWLRDTIWACPGQNIELPFTIIGTPPYTLNYQNKQGSYVHFLSEEREYYISHHVRGDEIVRIKSIVDGNGCTVNYEDLVIAVREKQMPWIKPLLDTTKVCPGTLSKVPLRLQAKDYARIIYSINGITQETTYRVTSLAPITIEWQVEALANRNYKILEIEDATGCKGRIDNSQVVIEVDTFANILPLITTNSPVCGTVPLQLSAQLIEGAANYIWQGPAGFMSTERSLTLNFPYAIGVYSLVVSNGRCSSRVATTLVTPGQQPPQIRAWGDERICQGEVAYLFATEVPGARYFWKGPNISLNNASNPAWVVGNVNETEVYSVYAVIGGCTSNIATHKVEVQSKPFANLLSEGIITLCQGELPRIVTLNVELKGMPPLTLKYKQNGTPAILYNLQPGIFSLPIRVIQNTSVELEEVMDASICGKGLVRGSAAIQVIPGPLPFIQHATPNRCEGASYSIGVRGGEAPYLFSISSFNFQNTTGIFEGLLPGVHTVRVTDRNGCSGVLSLRVDSLAPPQGINVVTNTDNYLISWQPISGVAFYRVHYRRKGEQNWNSLTTANASITLARSSSSIEYRIEGICTGGQFTRSTDIQEIVPTATCNAPAELVVNNVSSTSVELRWQSQPAVCYIVSYGLASEPEERWSEQMVPYPSNALVINDLMPGQTYVVRVRSNCSVCSIRSGNRSNYSAPVRFTTLPTKLADATVKSAFHVYPNPVQNGFWIQIHENVTEIVEVKIRDMQGKLVWQQALISGNEYISANTWGAGVYLLEIKRGKSTELFKLIKY